MPYPSPCKVCLFLDFLLGNLILVWDPFEPGAFPKYFKASLCLGPLKRRVLVPVGAVWASLSKVRHFPPAAKILFFADSVNFKAQTVIFGTTSILLSSVTVQTQTAVTPSFPERFLAIRDTEIGYLFTLDCLSLLRMTSLNFDSVLLAKNVYNYIEIKTEL